MEVGEGEIEDEVGMVWSAMIAADGEGGRLMMSWKSESD